ncbi:MAG: translocation protein TolB [Acidobacteriota bacterium]
MALIAYPSSHRSSLTAFATILLAFAAASSCSAQDWYHMEISKGNPELIRLAAADFKPTSADPATSTEKRAFDATLYNDLAAAGIFDMVAKSMLPQSTPGAQGEINLAQWASAPTSASMVAFGNLAVAGGTLIVNGTLDDAKNSGFPLVFTKRYTIPASEDSARQVAHQFADEIIFRLGGGIPGIAESKIYYIKDTGPNTKEIAEMDYDGANQHVLTHIGTDAMSPRVSPDNSRIAFSALDNRFGFQIRMFSLLLNRMVSFPSAGGANISPAWAPNGTQLAFSSSRGGRSEIWISDPQGNSARRLTSFGLDASPTWNPKTGAQIGFISGRTGLPQLYIMDADGSGVQRMTDGGYASSPSWSPNGQFIAFAWNRKYGPGAPGGQDIYVMEIATKRWIQLTHDIGRCDFPTWSPDGRHIAFATSPDGRQAHTRIMTMLADGTERRALTGSGADMPNWSWK